MISQKPYFIRALYDWIVDNGWTPHVQVDADWPGVEVPREYVQDGVIVLNISPTATHGLELGNERISFMTRFQGQERRVSFPPEAVLAIFSRETGQGMPFPPEPHPEPEAEQSPSAEAEQGDTAARQGERKVVQLKRVK
ncbi:ClpXP protease specificity-enhancing factor [Sulfurivirga sp.]|uniref:ClpXP protease specificity-enhancing factor n=1 Tax=Sulfurivirga sp. TaxID=2614236 RepID=UPI0025EA51B3|nr:ClpXP protease specificity-enhancing factor [Sulfurivirga sp.]